MTSGVVQFLAAAKSRLFNRRVSFKGACFASLLLHVVLLLAVMALLRVFETSSYYKPPLIFDFVFMPVEALDNSEATPQQSEVSKSRREKRTMNSGGFDLPEPTEETETVQAPPPIEGDSDVTDSNVKEVVEEKTRVDRDLVETIAPTPLLKPRSIPDRAAIVRVAMTLRQRKMLQKRLRKWAQDFHRMKLPDSTLVWKYKGSVYTAKFRHQAAKTPTDIDELLIEVGVEENGVKLSSEMRMKRLAFSNFTQFVDYWDPHVAIHDDVLEGRFHSNTKITLLNRRDVKPEFHGKVTTASYDVYISQESFASVSQESVFLGGLETGVRAIKLPKRFLPFTNDSTIQASRHQTFQEETWITFRRDGSYRWTTASARDGQTPIPADEPFFIVGSKKKKLHIKGILRGKVLVYSPGKIIIDDDLFYARHPEVTASASDYLGIVSDNDVQIASPSVTGPGDLTVFAAIYAKRRFRVPNRRGKRGATLTIYGSLTAGSLSATEPRYATHIRIDKRLEQHRPPNFPLTDRYEMLEWDGRWKVLPN